MLNKSKNGVYKFRSFPRRGRANTRLLPDAIVSKRKSVDVVVVVVVVVVVGVVIVDF